MSVTLSSEIKSVYRFRDYLTVLLRVHHWGWQLGRKCFVLKEGTRGSLGRGEHVGLP